MGFASKVRCLTFSLLFVALVLPFGIQYGMRHFMSTPLDPATGNVVPVSIDALEDVFRGKNALVVGATRGIGRGIALTLAKLGSNVRIVGRSSPGGAAVVAKMRDEARFPKQQSFKAYSHDLSNVKGALGFTSELDRDDFKIDFLVMTVGAWPDWEAPLSADGVDKVFSLDLLARFIVLTRASHLLTTDARVMNVLASTQRLMPPSIEEMKQLLQGKKLGTDLTSILSTAAVAADAFLSVASTKYDKISFVGTHPGLIDTELTRTTLPPWLETLKSILFRYSGVALSEEECGMIHAQILASPNVRSQQPSFFNSFYEGRKPTPIAADAIYGQWFWNFAENFIQEHS